MSSVQELTKIKQRVETAKTEAARLQGQLDQLLEQRGRDFGVGTDDEAETYLAELSAQEQALEKELDEGVQTIKDELGW